jgi:LmbE family N-acetylglucosaminyl deacetylase
MGRIKDKLGLTALVIVAHPDDETIWMGGTIAKYRNIDWTLFSLCRASDKDRHPKFLKVCSIYKAKCIMTDAEDEDKLDLKSSVRQIKKNINTKLKNLKFDFIFTHGKNGEYGHLKHRAVNMAVNELIKEKKIQPAAVFYFNYKKINRKPFSKIKIADDSDIIIKLTKKEFEKKVFIQSEIHGYPRNGIDVSYCLNQEAFKYKVLV